MNKFYITKIIAIFFGITTVYLFYLSWQGRLYSLVGSVELGVTLYLANTILLLASLTTFVWQRSHKDLPYHQRSKLLEVYAERESRNQDRKYSHITISDDNLLKLQDTSAAISVEVVENFNELHIGDTIQVTSPNNPWISTSARVMSVSDRTITLKRSDSTHK